MKADINAPTSTTVHAIDQTAMDIAKRLAKEYRRKREFWRYSAEDLQQDLLLHLVKIVHEFNPAINDNWSQFVYARLVKRAEDLKKANNTINGTGRRERMISFDQTVDRDEDGNPISLGETIPDRGLSIPDDVAFRLDLEEAMAKLPKEQRTVAERLLDGYTQAEIAADMGMNPVQFLRQYVTPIRRALSGVLSPDMI